MRLKDGRIRDYEMMKVFRTLGDNTEAIKHSIRRVNQTLIETQLKLAQREAEETRMERNKARNKAKREARKRLAAQRFW